MRSVLLVTLLCAWVANTGVAGREDDLLQRDGTKVAYLDSAGTSNDNNELTNDSGGSYHVEDYTDTKTEVRRLHAQAVAWWDKEAAKLKQFGLRDRMRVLDIGCGPGFISRELLASFPRSHVTCVELDPKLLKLARLRNTHTGRFKGVHASIDKMPLASNKYDFAVIRYLAQHLPDPHSAFVEVQRVLAPGGTVVVIDIDDQLSGIFQPGYQFQRDAMSSPDFMQAFAEHGHVLREFEALQKQKGGNRQIGRSLIPLLKQAGYEDVQLEMAIISSDEIGLEPFRALSIPDPFAGELFKKGLITKEVLDHSTMMLNHFFADKSSVIYSQEFMCAGSKPAD